MQEYYNKNYTLPPVPENLIPSLSDIISDGNICPTGNIKTTESIFAVYDASQEIYDIYEKYFESKVFIRWQVITADLPAHYDWGFSELKYLYLIDTGGDDVVTKFWSEMSGDPVTGGSFSHDDRNLVFEVKESAEQWFTLNVKKPHQVVNITRPRVALIIRPEY